MTDTEALEALDSVTRRLRKECPWDREQDERSIVPHTVEEAYELADAAQSGDDAKLLDELGDVLFQVYFLSLLLEEKATGSLGEVAEHCRQKLIRRHPHVFGDVEVANAAEVLENWDAIKATESGREAGIFGEIPDNLPGLLYARKVIRRARSADVEVDNLAAQTEQIVIKSRELADEQSRDQRFQLVGDLLFAATAAARELKVDPELAVRDAANRFKDSVLLQTTEVNDEQS